jgi:hypothetical protein
LKLVLHDLPPLAQKYSGTSERYNKICLLLIFVFLTSHVLSSNKMFRLKTAPISSGLDTILYFDDSINSRGRITNSAIDFINNEFKETESFIGLPSAEFLNYLTRRKNPARYSYFSPWQEALYGESEILQSYKENSAPYVVLVDREFLGVGTSYFGKDYGRKIFAWIAENYVVIRTIGEEPFKGKGFGIWILKRKDYNKSAGDL